MPSTVNQAFSEFLSNQVNLDSNKTALARKSRDWLVDRIVSLGGSDLTFPEIYSERNIAYGSFARKTKIRPLDDIDLMVALKAQGATYIDYSTRVEIAVAENPSNLSRFVFDGTKLLNSRKIVNAFVQLLKDVPQYQKAEMKRTQEAATLNLTSYDWNFDIVPCFFTTPESDGRTYYIIPDGNGYWKKTDPRIDRNNTREINQLHGGNILAPLRLLKYWNARKTAPKVPSYLLEVVALAFYKKSIFSQVSEYPDLAFSELIGHFSSAILSEVADPKSIQGNINTMQFADRLAVSSRAELDHSRAKEAWRIEQSGDQTKAISKWCEVFGPGFPH